MIKRLVRQAAVLAVAAFAAVLAFAAPASAAGAPKFHSATSSVNNSGALVVNFDERGLGNENVHYVLTANASALFACINGGKKHPQAANKETFNSEVSGNATLEPKNGRIVDSISAGPPSAGGFSCPPGQRLVLASVTYTNVLLTDTTNGVSTSVANASRVFFQV